MKALYPGSFDPVTLGHIDVAERAAKLFDGLTVAVFEHPDKAAMFSVDERIEFLTASLNGIANIKIGAYSGLLADYAVKNDFRVIVRGVRNASDYEIEFQRAAANRVLSNGIETVLLVSDPALSFLSSGMAREIIKAGRGSSALEAVTPRRVAEAAKLKFNIKG